MIDEYDDIYEYDECCLNCMYWGVNYQMHGPAQGTICKKGHGFTGPNDVCNDFYLTDEDTDLCVAGGGTYIGDTRDDKLRHYLDYLE